MEDMGLEVMLGRGNRWRQARVWCQKRLRWWSGTSGVAENHVIVVEWRGCFSIVDLLQRKSQGIRVRRKGRSSHRAGRLHSSLRNRGRWFAIERKPPRSLRRILLYLVTPQLALLSLLKTIPPVLDLSLAPVAEICRNQCPCSSIPSHQVLDSPAFERRKGAMVEFVSQILEPSLGALFWTSSSHEIRDLIPIVRSVLRHESNQEVIFFLGPVAFSIRRHSWIKLEAVGKRGVPAMERYLEERDRYSARSLVCRGIVFFLW